MSGISKHYLATLLIAVASACMCVWGQSLEERQYQRASIYNIMVKRPNLQYSKEIEYVFTSMDVPERFNDHGLGVSSVMLANLDNLQASIQGFVDKAQIGKRMVAKWFDRDKNTGAFDLDLIRERGLYNATLLDVNLANKQARGLAVLEDAGENLLSNTFLVVTDIYYIDKSERWSQIADIVGVTANIAKGVMETKMGVQSSTFNKDGEDLFKNAELSWLTEGVMGNIKGFRVKATSYLYQLEWTDEAAGIFYNNYYQDASQLSDAKTEAFQKSKNEFRLKFVGSVESKSSHTVLSGVKTNEELLRKVCTRALDKNLSDLQHKFEAFRIKAPLISAEPLQCAIGMKEDVSSDSRFEVLEEIEREDGSREFKRVGVIRPKKGQIWDNRFMASLESENEDALLHVTTFEKVSGGPFATGMLIREIDK